MLQQNVNNGDQIKAQEMVVEDDQNDIEGGGHEIDGDDD